MPPQLEEKLRSIGWFPGRRLDDDQFHEWLHFVADNFGCRIFPEAVRILREYGNLTFGMIHFNPTEIHACSEKIDWLYWEWNVKEVLYPIAYWLSGGMTYAISSTGKIYAAGDADLLCGDNFEQFLTNMIEGRKSIETPYAGWTTEMENEVEQVHDALYGPETDR